MPVKILKRFVSPANRTKLKQLVVSFFRIDLATDIDYGLRLRALDTTCAYIEAHMIDVPVFKGKFGVLNHALDAVRIKNGLVCEFGVWKGESMNHIAKRMPQQVHAFDSFEGLPENWLPNVPKGHFAVPELPQFEPNVMVHKGWFDDTLPPFVAKYDGPLAFLHVDCDLYSSTKSIFDALGDRIVPDTIILFDDYFNYPFWQHHEHKAFQEFVEAHDVKYEYLCYNSGEFCSEVAVRVLDRS